MKARQGGFRRHLVIAVESCIARAASGVILAHRLSAAGRALHTLAAVEVANAITAAAAAAGTTLEKTAIATTSTGVQSGIEAVMIIAAAHHRSAETCEMCETRKHQLHRHQQTSHLPLD